MEGPKKNPDKLNTVGIVTVGAVGSALVYLSIVGLQAFYVNETSAVDEVAAFGDQAKARTSLKAAQVGKITEARRMGWNAPDGKPVVSLKIDVAMQLVARDAKVDPANLVPVVGRSDKGTIQPIFGRPVALPPPPPPPADPAGGVPGAVPPDGAAPAVPADGAATPAAPGAATPTPAPAAPAPAAPAPPAPPAPAAPAAPAPAGGAR